MDTFSSLMALLIEYKYAVLFPVLVIEGPIATLVAAFLASPGGGNVMSVTLVTIIVFVADVVGDTMYYLIGRYGKKLVRLDPKRLAGIERYYRSHGVKTVILGKFSHGLGWPVMVGAGTTHMPYGKFIGVSAAVSVVKSIGLVALGYFYGKHYEVLTDHLGKTGLIVTTIMVLAISYFAWSTWEGEKEL